MDANWQRDPLVDRRHERPRRSGNLCGSDRHLRRPCNDIARLGPDDVGERETVPPYDKPLRGVQVRAAALRAR